MTLLRINFWGKSSHPLLLCMMPKKKPKVCIAMCQYFLFGLSCISQPPLYSFAVHTHISKFCLQVTIESNWILFGPESSLQTPTIVLLPVATVSHHQSSPRQIVKCCLVFFQWSVCSEMYALLLVSWLLPLANHFFSFWACISPSTKWIRKYLPLQPNLETKWGRVKAVWYLWHCTHSCKGACILNVYLRSPAHQGLMLPLHRGSSCAEW